MRLLVPRWYDLVLVAGVTSAISYIRIAPSRGDTPWLSLWANATTDLFIIWLAGRVIDGLISSRQRRQQVVNGFRGNINFMMKGAAGLLPEAYAWAIRNLADEIRWFDIRLKRQAKYLRKDERVRAQDFRQRLDPIMAEIREYQSFKRESDRQSDLAGADTAELQDAEGKKVWRHELVMMRRVEAEFRQYLRDPDVEPAKVLVAATGARREVDDLADSSAKESLQLYLVAVEGLVRVSEGLKQRIRSLVEFVHETEVVFLERIEP